MMSILCVGRHNKIIPMQTLTVFIVSAVPGDCISYISYSCSQTANMDNLLFFIFSTRVLLLCSDRDLRKHFLPAASLPGGSEVSQKLFLTSRKFKPSIAAPLISLRTWMLTCKSCNLISRILYTRTYNLTLSISFSAGLSSFKVRRFFCRAGWFAIQRESQNLLHIPLLIFGNMLTFSHPANLLMEHSEN